MRPGTRRLPILLLLLAFGFSGCGERGSKARPVGDGTFLLHGRVLDQSTGEAVSRDEIYLHFFNDDVEHQLTLDPADSSDYAVRMPRATIRVRAFDRTARYHLFETTVTLDQAERAFDIPLRPTDYVLLQGRVMDGATGKPVVPTSGMGAGPLLYIAAKGTSWRGQSLVPGADGSFSFRAPRAILTISAVNTAKRLRAETLDLTGVEGAEHAVEIVLE